MTAGPQEVVIATKLFAPSPRHEPVSRPRLYARLREGLRRPLTLVVAPAGWGKSTLVAGWLRRDDITTGWVSLDASDDDIKRFWRYLLLAADRAGTELGSAALRRLDAPGTDVLRDVLPVFVNDLAGAAADVVIVLDDYHVVTMPQVHESVATLLDRCPPQLHLIVSTRSDPPLQLSRMRVRGDLVEVRAEHLRFTVEEAADLLNGGLGLSLSPNDVHRLVVRTEGWAAGLQLAALRLADRADRSEFIARFTGADRHVVDYLGEEVLANQPEHVRDFLLRTSVLNRMCPELVDAVTGRDDGVGLLDEIYRANLFLTPLDDELVWFRYHQLFRGILRHELGRIAPDEPPELHGRAARWYAAHGDVTEAVGHAVESHDSALAAQLVAEAWRSEFNAGRLQTVQTWLDALPAEIVSADAQLSTAQVWLALDSGRLDDVAAALGAAERAMPGDVHLVVLRALYTFKSGDLSGAARLVGRVERQPGDPFVSTVHSLLMGVTAMWSADRHRSGEMLRDAAVHALRDGNRLAHIYARGCLALLSVETGNLPAAEILVREVDAEVTQTLSDAHFVAMFPALARARLAAVSGDWVEALPAALTAVELAGRGAGRLEVVGALLTAAMVARGVARSDESGATPADWMAMARVVLGECADPGPVLLAWQSAEQRGHRSAGPSRGVVDPLTEREQAILRLLPGPMSQRELASALFVTANTLKTHLRAIYRKLGAESRGDAVARARSLGLI
jgi:LuxR family transcriptional regulator, maltose regulon positive regulatory protein